MIDQLTPPNSLPAASGGGLLDVGQVASLLNCSARHVYRLRDRGALPPPVRLGALVRWSHSAIEQWVADGCPDYRKGGRR
jgi:excisionase family DNA binding protein